jgi:outer membrane cobalamin receptor
MMTILHSALLILSSGLRADSAMVDSLRESEVIVVAEPWQQSMQLATQSKLTFTRQQLRALAPWQARDVLSLVPGVFVLDYGGASALQTVSFRGGSSSQALVMLDGARFSSAQSGSADISMIPMRYVSSVDVTRGGASALYGANALHGAVDMRLRLPVQDGYRISTMGGSFDQWTLSAGTTQSVGRSSVGADLEFMGSAGSFPFTTSQFGSTFDINRQNNDVRATRGIIRVEDRDSYAATMLLRSVDRGVPGAVVQGNITQARARMQDVDAIGTWSASLSPSSRERSSWKLAGSLRYLDQAFQDPDATIVGSQGIDVRYLQRDVTQSLLADYHDVLPSSLYTWNVRGRIDASYADIRGPLLQGANAPLFRSSLATTLDADVVGYGQTPWVARAAARCEFFSDVGLVVSPLIGLRLPLGTSTVLRALWSYNVRPPSFNELYYLNYGTKDLRPERSQTTELALHMQPADWFDVSVTGYHISTRDLIVSVPVSPVIMSAQNVGAASTYGAELVARAAILRDKLRLQYSYAYMQARDATKRPYLDGTFLPYSPPEVLSALVLWTDLRWFASATVSYTSYRYHSTGSTFASLLQPFTLVGMQGGVRLRTSRTEIDIRMQCDNLFDASYVVVRGFPMPGRTFRLIVSMELGA